MQPLKTASLALYHNVDPLKVTSIKITDTANNNRVVVDVSATVSSPVRRTFSLSYNSWVSLATGKLLLTLTYGGNGGAIRGLFGCANSSDCTIPSPVLNPKQCISQQTSGQLVNAPVFLDGPLPDWPRWTSWSWNGSASDSHFTTLNFSSTDSVLCGNSSIFIGLENGALDLAYPGNVGGGVPVLTINPSQTPYLQFWARTKDVSTSLTLRLTINDGKSGFALQVGPQYVLNYVIEESWTRVNIPLSAFNLTGGNSQTIQQIIFQQWPGYGNSYLEFFIDEITFTNANDGAVSTSPVSNFAMWSTPQQCPVVGASSPSASGSIPAPASLSRSSVSLPSISKSGSVAPASLSKSGSVAPSISRSSIPSLTSSVSKTPYPSGTVPPTPSRTPSTVPSSSVSPSLTSNEFKSGSSMPSYTPMWTSTFTNSEYLSSEQQGGSNSNNTGSSGNDQNVGSPASSLLSWINLL